MHTVKAQFCPNFEMLRGRQGCSKKMSKDFTKTNAGKKFQISKHLGLQALLELFKQRKGDSGRKLSFFNQT